MRQERLFQLLALLLSSALLLLLLETILRFLPVSDAALGLPVEASNPVPRLQPGREFVFSKGWNFSLVVHKRANNYGFLSDQDYQREGPRPLVAAIGDSYVEAMQVPNAVGFPGVLGNALGDSGRVYAFGLSGAGLSTYLAYAEFAAREFAPDGMVFSIISNDYDESLLEYMRQPRNHYFVADSRGDLVLYRYDYSPSWGKRAARRSALIRYLMLNCRLTPRAIAESLRALTHRDAYVGNTLASADPERLADSQRVVDAFFRELPAASSLPPERIGFILDGVRPELYSADALLRAHASYAWSMREHFMSGARARGYEVIDLGPIFERMHRVDGSRFEFDVDNHWNELGHAVAARAVCESALFARLFGSQGCGEIP